MASDRNGASDRDGASGTDGAQARETDVAIIGAGPAGLFAAFECGMLRLRCVLVDSLAEAGGQCAALYPEKPIYDIPAHPAIDGGTLVAALERQIAPFAVPRLLGRRVESLEGRCPDFTLRTDRGDIVRARAVVIAAGAGAFGPNRPPLAGLPAFEASGAVQYYVRRKEAFRDASVVIAGGGDSAVDWALALGDIAARIYLVHRRPKFRAAPESLSRLEAACAPGGRVELVVPYQLHALHGEAGHGEAGHGEAGHGKAGHGKAGQLAAVEVATLEGERRMLQATHLLPFFGLSTDLGPIAQWGLGSAKHHIPVTPSSCETSCRGVFAIGDVASYPGKLKLILQGFSEGAMAAHAIHPIVHPDTALHFEYSTSKGVPAA